jgi:hypothetical protein
MWQHLSVSRYDHLRCGVALISLPSHALHRARIAAAGSRLLEVSATPGWLRPVHYLDPSTARVPAFTMAEATDGVKSRPSGDDASVIGRGAKQFCLDMAADSWTHTRQVDFGSGGHTKILLRVKATTAVEMSLHLDKLSAHPTATCTVPAAAEWTTMACNVPTDSELSGVHDLWIKVQKAGSSSPVPAALMVAGVGCTVSDAVCYSDNSSVRTLSGANPGGQAPPIGKAGPLTPEYCAWQCSQLNFSLAGVEYHTECYCADAISSHAEELATDHCALPCSGRRNKTAEAETCGGFDAVSVFKVDCSGAVPAPCYPNGTQPQPAPDPTPIVAFAWWQLQGGAAFIRRTPPKTKVSLNITTSATAGSLPVAVSAAKKLVARGAEHALLVLVDNEDGTYALQYNTSYACAVVPPAGGGAELALTARTPTEACARFRVQVIKDTTKIATGSHFALRSAAIGLWVSACTATHTPDVCPLTVTAPNPLTDTRAIFRLDALSGAQTVPPH